MAGGRTLDKCNQRETDQERKWSQKGMELEKLHKGIKEVIKSQSQMA